MSMLAQRVIWCDPAMYGEIMQTTPDLVDVSFRELGEGNLWRCETTGPGAERCPSETTTPLVDTLRKENARVTA